MLVVFLAAACQQPSDRAGADPATADGARELRVITSGGFTAAYNKLAPDFEKMSGIKLVTAYGASSGGAPDSIPSRLSRGEEADVIILSRPSLDILAEQGYVLPGSRTDLVRSSIGVAVRKGRPRPEIGSTESFVNIVLAADSIGYSASASGTYLSTVLFPRLGIWEQTEPKSKRISSERVAAVVARGEVEIGFQQISEILPIAGVDYVGPIPHELQEVTTFSAGILTQAASPRDAQALIDYLSSVNVASAIGETGLEPVVLDVP